MNLVIDIKANSTVVSEGSALCCERGAQFCESRHVANKFHQCMKLSLTMDPQKILHSIIDSDVELEKHQLLDYILPKRDEPYSLVEVERVSKLFHDAIEIVQRASNDQFDALLTKDTKHRFQNLYQTLHNVQLNIMKLQCEIAFTREQYDIVQSINNSSLIHERRELLIQEENLKTSLQQLKFDALKTFFDRFSTHLNNIVKTIKKTISQQASSYLQYFDWTRYLNILYLLQACGKVLKDVENFERLYQSDVEIISITFKQPIEKMDLNNFIEFPDSFSLESQLEIKPKLDFEILNSQVDDYKLFDEYHTKFKNVTIEFCRLIVDINVNYIEAHLTDGINIDKLNGGEHSTLSADEEPSLPLYALSPQDYITQIGQHLLTLRKQTGQFDSLESDSLKFALSFLNEAQNIRLEVESYQTITEIVMRCIARHCIRSLLGRTGTSILSKLTTNGRRQLATDALYLDNVLEDLGLLDSNEPNVEKFKCLLTH